MGPLLGKLAAKQAMRHAGRRGWLDFGTGFQLLRDPRVHWSSKLLALGLGLLFTAVLALLEVPLEAVLAFLLPALGLFLDFAVDGLEFVIFPVLIAAAILPHMVRPIEARLTRPSRRV